MNWGLFCGCVALCVVACSNRATTQELLDGNPLLQGQTAIDLISPADEAATTTTPTLTWAAKPGIGRYRVEISSKQDFSNIVVNKITSINSYAINPSDLIGLTALDSTQYYWRVSVPHVASSLTSKPYRINVISADAVYVYASSTASVQVGNKAAPFKLIQDAISAANVLRNSNPNVSVSVRVAKGSYVESVYLKPGISLYGGYDPNDWTRNIALNVTNVTGVTADTITAGSDITTAFTTTTTVDGFFIYGSSSGTATRAVYLLNGSPTISGNFIFGGTTNSTYGVYANASSAVVKANTIDATNGTSSSWGMYVTFTSAFGIYNNVINGGAGSSQRIGIEIQSATATITNNTITVGTTAGGTAYGLMTTSGTTTITNNIIYTGSGGTRQCVRFATPPVTTYNAKSFQNNLLFDCPSALVNNAAGTLFSTEAQIIVPANVTTGNANTATGNLGNDAGATLPSLTFSGVNFTSTSDLHLTSSTPSQIRSGGKDTSQAACGPSLNASCGDITTDRDGNPRTIPYSIGAFEKD